MTIKKQRLELTWIGKDNPEYDIANIEPRILEERTDLSYGDKNTENMIIHGDNLLALKALLPEYEGKVKCVYIDPPYNTGNAFEHYDDSVEHSTWLSLMRPRLELLQALLRNDGAIFIQIDDQEFAYLKIVCDEIFGRDNFINCVTVKTKSSAGASGGGEDKKLKKHTEFIMFYAKDRDSFSFNPIFIEENLMEIIESKRDDGKSFEYKSVMVAEGEKEYFNTVQDGSGNDIKIFKHKNYQIDTISKLMKVDGCNEQDAYFKYFEKIFRGQPAQSSIRTRVNEATGNNKDLFSIEYTPRSGKRKGEVATNYYLNCDLVNWLSDTSRKKGNKIIKLEKLGTLWTDLSWNGLSSQGGINFNNGKKPELLLDRILKLVTNKNDFVLDSFLGSGTTVAVAHKMERKYIGIEMGEHAYTHCKARLDKVVDGSDQGGISKTINWQGGGGYKFYELAPSFVTIDEFGNQIIDGYYSDTKLIKAMCKLTNYTFLPSAIDYWKQGKGQGNNSIYVTTQMLSVAVVTSIASRLRQNESLLICPKKFEPGCESVDPRITIKKIPQSILKACHFGRKEYLLPIKETTIEELEEDLGDNEE
jgi:adenine-specific DNA-methyltransferase